jgi:hypothetical protein
MSKTSLKYTHTYHLHELLQQPRLLLCSLQRARHYRQAHSPQQHHGAVRGAAVTSIHRQNNQLAPVEGMQMALMRHPHMS